MNGKTTSALIWSVAELLRGNFKQSEYGRVILPFTILRRLDCVLEPTKLAVLQEYETKQAMLPSALSLFLAKAAGFSFYNYSRFTLSSLLGDPANVRSNLTSYLSLFSDNVRDVFERFNFQAMITGWTRTTCCFWLPGNSPPWTCIPTRLATPRWAPCSRS